MRDLKASVPRFEPREEQKVKMIRGIIFSESVDADLSGGVDPKAISLYPTDSTYSLYAIDRFPYHFITNSPIEC